MTHNNNNDSHAAHIAVNEGRSPSPSSSASSTEEDDGTRRALHVHNQSKLATHSIEADFKRRVRTVERLMCSPSYVAWERAGNVGKARRVPKPPDPFRRRTSTRAFAGRVLKYRGWLQDFAGVHTTLVASPEVVQIAAERLATWSAKWKAIRTDVIRRLST